MHYLVDGHRVQLEYLVATARYDLDMKLKLDSFETTCTLAALGEKKLFTPAQCDFNIVKNPQKRTEINETWVAHLSKGKEITRCGEMKLWKGMYLISHKNDGAIVNSTRYRVLNLKENLVGLKEEISGTKVRSHLQADRGLVQVRLCRHGHACDLSHYSWSLQHSGVFTYGLERDVRSSFSRSSR